MEEDNSTYIGDTYNEKKSGYGRKVYPNGSVYEGFWYQGKRQGQGRYANNTGKFYSGNYSMGEKDGHGALLKESGTYYIGMWKNGKRFGKGKGKVIKKDGRTIEGEMENGVFKGEVNIRYLNSGKEYRGGYMNDKYHGKGKPFFALIFREIDLTGRET